MGNNNFPVENLGTLSSSNETATEIKEILTEIVLATKNLRHRKAGSCFKRNDAD